MSEIPNPTPKQQYEARKAERNKRREAKATLGHEQKDILMEDMLDRFVTAIERLADSLEAFSTAHISQAPSPKNNPTQVATEEGT